MICSSALPFAWRILPPEKIRHRKGTRNDIRDLVHKTFIATYLLEPSSNQISIHPGIVTRMLQRRGHHLNALHSRRGTSNPKHNPYRYFPEVDVLLCHAHFRATRLSTHEKVSDAERLAPGKREPRSSAPPRDITVERSDRGSTL